MILFDYDDASLELSISGDTDLLKNNRSFWFFLNSEFTLIHKDDGNIRILLAPEELEGRAPSHICSKLIVASVRVV